VARVGVTLVPVGISKRTRAAVKDAPARNTLHMDRPAWRRNRSSTLCVRPIANA
jgi:hypothetical protein